MPDNLDTSRSESGLVAHYLLVPPGSGKVTRVEFSPSFPDYVTVLFEDRPPRLFDVRRDLPDAIKRSVINEDPTPTVLDERVEVPIKFHVPACAAAFRTNPQSKRAEEVAFAFGEGDCMVYRFGVRNKRARPSIEMEEPIALAYSSCGGRLVCGGKNGLLALYDVEESPILVNSARANGEVLAVDINYRNFCYGVTNQGRIFGFGPRHLSSQTFEFKKGFDDGQRQANWTALACDPNSSLLLVASAEGRFWLARTESFDGAICDSVAKVLSAQFVGESQIVVTGRGGVVVHQYARNDEGRVTAVGLGDVFDVENGGKSTVVGARYYTWGGSNCVCIALAL